MFARAFACYVHDKLKEQGIRDDYLTGHAYSGSPVPVGDEKARIYEKMEEFLAKCKEKEFLRDGHPDFDRKVISTLEKENPSFTKEEIEKAVKDNNEMSYLQLDSLFAKVKSQEDHEPERVKRYEQLQL